MSPTSAMMSSATASSPTIDITELPESGMYNVAGILSVWNDVVSFYPTAFYDPTTGIAATRIDAGATAAPEVFDLSGRRTTMNAKGLKIVRKGGKTKKMF